MGCNKVTDVNRLSINRPDLVQDWNWKKNNLSPSDVACNSTRKVWWKCHKCDFEWQCKIVHRHRYKHAGANGRTRITKTPSFCPYCKSAIVNNKKLMQEWNWCKNKIHPCMVENHTGRYWWTCSMCNYEWETFIRNRVNGYGGNCIKCNSLYVKFPYIAKEFSDRNLITPDKVNYGTTKKFLWKCQYCNFEWGATVNSRTSGGNGCPKCSKVKLKNGMTFDSKTEAYFYLKLKEKYDDIQYNGKYGRGMGNSRYDFYIPSEETYIEVTSFHKKSMNVSYVSYLRNIVRKKRYVEGIGAKFRFVQLRLCKEQTLLIDKFV